MKVFTGKVVAVKTAKTAIVAVERVVVHPLYKKRFKRIKKYQVHDEKGVKAGETVKFVADRPHSKLKKWKIIEALGGVDKKPETPDSVDSKKITRIRKKSMKPNEKSV